MTKNINQNASSSIVYGLGFVGAAIYFIWQATTFGIGVIAVLKAIVWPVFLVHGVLKYLWL